MKRTITSFLTVIFLFVWTLPVLADQLSEAQRKQQNIQDSLNNISRQKQQVKKNQDQLNQDKKKIISQQNQQDSEYQKIKGQLDSVNKELDELESSVTDAQANYDSQVELFKNRLRVMYENSSGNSYLNTLLQSKSIVDFFSRLELVSMISKSDKEMVNQLQIAKQDIQYKQKMKEQVLADTKDQASDKKAQINNLSNSKASLDAELKKKQDQLAKLDAQEDAFAEQSKEVERQIKALQKKGTKYSGSMMWPSEASTLITSSYGYRIDPIRKTRRFHTGIDIGASKGTSILAANKGTVIFAGWNGAYGNCVIIDHGGGISTLYAHSCKLLVSVGDNVKKGHVIALVGSTGNSTGPHLHFEVRVNGATVNPLNYVSP
ncbi:MAG: peptidoglycan DD-metalloendopeptidase family protein [Bacillota bacterium]|nr:peptidoglycan DD-metalloendopeptidase family protein [Bacillota bacterium]